MPLPSPWKRQRAIYYVCLYRFVSTDGRYSPFQVDKSHAISITSPLPPRCFLRVGFHCQLTVPYALPRTMMCSLYCVFPLLLVTSALSLPSSWPYRNADGLQQAAFQVKGLSKESFREWELPPNPNSTHHLIFNSVSGLLQRWPNTLRRNGALDRSLPIHRTIW